MPGYLTVLYICNQLFHYLQDILSEVEQFYTCKMVLVG